VANETHLLILLFEGIWEKCKILCGIEKVMIIKSWVLFVDILRTSLVVY
jgi:hypothetical protein